jgi:hypothetical protein
MSFKKALKKWDENLLIQSNISIKYSPEEIALKNGMQYFDRAVYEEIRKYMDGKTLIAGVVVPMKYHNLAAGLRVNTAAGSHAENGTPTERAIMCAIDRLKQRGLVEKMSKDRALILLCPYAPRSNPKKIATSEERQIRASDEEEDNLSKKIDVLDLSTALGTEDSFCGATSPISKISNNNIYTYSDDQKSNTQTPKAKYREIISDYGFDLYALTRDSSLEMYEELTEAQVIEEDIRKGIEQAHLKKGKKPDAPAYYKNFILSAQEWRLRNANKANLPTDSRTGTLPRVYSGSRNSGNGASKSKSNHTRILEELERDIIGSSGEDIF